MLDGTGTTTYAYHPAGSAGAGQLASVDGPLPNDTITYAYDELGRVKTRAINGAANTVTWTYDALGRTTAEQNVLGTFTYGYVGPTARLAAVTYPNGQTSSYSYYGNSGDQRLQTIHHKYPNGSTLSKFDYTYDVIGNIQTWRQQADESAVVWKYGYDPADQLTSAITHATDPQESILKRYYYTYDPAGNRTSEQIDDSITTDSHDVLNRLIRQTPGGALVFRGQLDEPGTVTINGRPATVSADHRFEGTAQVTSGTNTVTIVATDVSGNSRAQNYEVDIAGSAKTLTYDANGNLVSDGARTFEWDARNQIAAITVGTHRTEFSYDGLQRRVWEVEREDGTTQSDTRVVWCETAICEERTADGVTVTRRMFRLGERTGDLAQFFATDHLGSVSEVAEVSSMLLARYAFDPWGRRTMTAGVGGTTVGYTGHKMHEASALALTVFRGYEPALARWLSQDPASHVGGLNLYGYVANNPIRNVDPLGLAPWDFVLCWWYYPKCSKSAKKCEAELRKRDMLEVLLENNCPSWGALVVKKCFVENPDCEKTWKYCGKSTIPWRPPGTR